MPNFHEEIVSTKEAERAFDICVREVETRTRLIINNRPTVRVVSEDEFEFVSSWYSAYKEDENLIVLKEGAKLVNLVHELIHANTDLSAGYDFGENFANYFTFLTCESLHKADRPVRERNIRDFLTGIGSIEKLRVLIGEDIFGSLVTDFYEGLNQILVAIGEKELSQLEIDVLKYLVGWARLRHITFQFFQFRSEDIAKNLGADEEDVEVAVKNLRHLGFLEQLDSSADSVFRDRVFELCEQYAKSKKGQLIFFYR